MGMSKSKPSGLALDPFDILCLHHDHCSFVFSCINIQQGWPVKATPGFNRWLKPALAGPVNTSKVANTGYYWLILLNLIKKCPKSNKQQQHYLKMFYCYTSLFIVHCARKYQSKLFKMTQGQG